MIGAVDTGLLRAARAEYEALILPALPAELRYTGAMLKRSLDILLAQATAQAAPESVFADAGFGSAKGVAAQLRSGAMRDSPALRAALRAYVERKLEQTNPRFLKETNAAAPEARL